MRNKIIIFLLFLFLGILSFEAEARPYKQIRKLMRKGNYPTALREARKIYRGLERKQSVQDDEKIDILKLLVKLNKRVGNNDGALKYLQIYLKIIEKQKEMKTRESVNIKYETAELYLSTGYGEKAEKLYSELLNVVKREHRTMEIILTQRKLAQNSYLNFYDFKKALKIYREVYEFAEKNRLRKLEFGKACLDYGNGLRICNEYKSAEIYLLKGHEIFRNIEYGDYERIKSGNILLAFYLETKEFEKAKIIARENFNLSERLIHYFDKRVLLENYANYCFKTSRKSEGNSILKLIKNLRKNK